MYSGIKNVLLRSGGSMFGECMWISSHKPSKDIGRTQAYRATDLGFSWPVLSLAISHAVNTRILTGTKPASFTSLALLPVASYEVVGMFLTIPSSPFQNRSCLSFPFLSEETTVTGNPQSNLSVESCAITIACFLLVS
mgnify:CR=1 FL=1